MSRLRNLLECPPPTRRLIFSIRWAEVAVTIWTLALAAWQLLLIDRSMYGFLLVWMSPAFIAVAIRVFALRCANPPELVRVLTPWAAVYLAVMSVVMMAASNPAVFPSMQALHTGGTEFADTWNRLDLVSRRVIATNMTLAAISVFAFIGYTLGMTIRRERIAQTVTDG
jgi:hypothetical protein